MRQTARKLFRAVLWMALLIASPSASATAQVAPLTERTTCDQPEWNAKFGIYQKLYRPSLHIERDALYDHINDFSKKAKLVENGLQIYSALNTIAGNVQMETATDVTAGALSTAGEAVGVFGESTASIAADQLLEWGKLAVKRDPKTFVNYFATNTLEAAAGLYATVGMNALIDEYRLVSSADRVLFAYYRHCGDRADVRDALGFPQHFEDSEGSIDFLSWATLQNAPKGSYSSSERARLTEMISQVVTGVNTAHDQLSGSAVATGTPDLEPYTPDPHSNTASPGAQITVEFGAENEGEGAAEASQARLRLTTSPDQVTTNDPVLTTVDMSALQSGASSRFEKTVTLPSDLEAGTYYIWLILDVNSEAGQRPANEENDKAYEDLRIEHLTPDLEPSSMGTTPSSARPGDEVKVELDVDNWGEGAAQASQARLRLTTSDDRVTVQDRELATIDVPALAPEEEVHIEKIVQLPPDLSGGRYYIWVTLDVTSRAGQLFADEENDKTYEGISVEE